MKTPATCLLAVLAVLSILLPQPGRCEVVDRIVAIVNDDFITLKDVERFVRLEKEGKFLSVREYFRNVRLQVRIDTFIDDLLVRQQAGKLRIDVSDKEVDGILDNLRKQHLVTETEMKDQLQKEGISYKDFLDGIRMNLLRTRVLSRAISPEVLVTDKMLRTHYDQRKDEYSNDEYRLKQIFISGKREDGEQRALAAYDSISKGRSFDAAAKEFSDDPSAAAGGDIGYVKGEELIPELRDAVSSIAQGANTQVLRTPYGFHILKLIEVKKGETLAFDTVKDKIHARIVQEESEKRYKEYVAKLRRASYIEVKI